MQLSSGARLGPYEILSLIGSGGMGEVYAARDPRLARDVAIKVLPTAFSADVNRLHRFEQEARAAAALNHPNILAVYDIGTDAGAPFIVSELLEGETLRDRLLAGPVAVRKAIELARHIARGLAAAHDKGITHRDLKPENVFVTRDNRVKILDFGLAKLTQDQPALAAASALATASPTQPGVVLGTVGYMAPEQVRGLPADHRADLFAFGAILYELLSGLRAFRRDSASETMTAILNEDPPDLSAARAPIPPALVRIVNRCLEKNPADRFQTASDLAFALDGLSDSPSTSAPAGAATHRVRRTGLEWLGWGAATLLLATLGPLAYRHVGERSAAVSPMRFQISATVDFAGPGNFSLSPDGRHLVFVGRGSDGIARLWIRAMDSLELRPLPSSETPEIEPPPFWSPDGRFVAFDAGGKLKKLDVSGGLPQTVCDLPSLALGGSWNRDGDIIVGNLAGGLLRVRETGGTASPITAVDPSRKEEVHIFPTFLPDGRHFVYMRLFSGAADSGIYIGTLDARPDEQSHQRLMPYEIGLTYVVSGDSGAGRLLFVREGTLMEQPFDAKRLALAGEAAPVAQRVGSFRDSGFFAASNNDVLVYRTEPDLQITWFDRQGAVAGHVSEPGAFRHVALSPDGARAVASRTDPQDTAKADLWLFDLRGGGATRVTLGTGIAEFPVWSPDGQRVIFTFNHKALRQKLASGEGDEKELLRIESAGIAWARSWSPDGRFLLYTANSPGSKASRPVLWVLPINGPQPVPFAGTQFVEDQGRFSPDGRWVAYVSNQSGTNEVYVRRFAPDFSSGSAATGGSVLVSRGGGTAPCWRGDGRELFYFAPNGKMMAVDVTAVQEFKAGTPTPLFQAPPGTTVGDVTADGKRFLLLAPVAPTGTMPFTVVLNWTAGFKK